MKKLLTAILFGMVLPCNTYADFVFKQNENVNVLLNIDEAEVVKTALDIFEKDYRNVFSGSFLKSANTQIIIGTLGNNSLSEATINKKNIEELRLHAEGFILSVQNDKLYILGNDKRGTAYGILELSRLIGVSPWEWWADAHPEKKAVFNLKNGYFKIEYPSVKHRGIFINDEDWGMMPWASKNYEPGLPTVGNKTKGAIGPKAYARIFELLLRLRANTIWPAMHEVTVPFYFTKGNKEVADKYGIIVGTSHCEPLMRNSVNEWDSVGKGDYNYTTNKKAMLSYWADRLKELKGSENIYTIGLRGKHDGMMQGVKTLQEHKTVLAQVIKDERDLLQKYVDQDVTKVPQIFVPYKEVLDVYNDGLQVPDDVTLVWCDDNYGYITHFPNEKERARKGGNGIYYHVSYWGRPHDYLWLASTSPALLYQQMKLAYDKGAKDLWILNVGDIKPAEYLTELFMDMAWDMGSVESNINGLDKHLYTWLSREFGENKAKELLPVMTEYYRLAYIRKPEFMGATREEEKDPKYKIVSDLPWSETEINQRIRDYSLIENKVIELSKKIPESQQESWFELIEYPVRGAAELNKKLLYAQLARHGNSDWNVSDAAYDSIVSLTETYNALANGKWKYIMDMQPHNLSVFKKIPRTKDSTALLADKQPLFLFNGNQYAKYIGQKPIVYGFGYQRAAVVLAQGSSVVYSFTSSSADSVTIELSMVPTHPVSGTQIRYAIRLDGETEQVVDYATQGRSEEWKENVLNNRTVRVMRHHLSKRKNHTITIRAIDEDVILDQVKVW